MSADDRAAARDEIWRRLEAGGVDDDTAYIVDAAFDERELAEALKGARLERPEPERSKPVEPKRAYLAGISVEGFRGIGPRADLAVKPGPGLTVVSGRNGSGKSRVKASSAASELVEWMREIGLEGAANELPLREVLDLDGCPVKERTLRAYMEGKLAPAQEVESLPSRRDVAVRSLLG